jgi:nicotinamidase-related amidase
MTAPERLVLISIDMQQGFEMPGRPRRGNPDLDRNGFALLDAWRRRGAPVIHVRHDSLDPASCFHPAAPGNAFRSGFGPIADEGLVVKSVSSAFIGTDLDLRLRRLKAEGIVLFGMRSDMCLSSTARSGAALGWPVVVVADASDCCDTPEPFGPGVIPAEDIHRVHLATLADEFARVVTTAEAAAMLDA